MDGVSPRRQRSTVLALLAWGSAAQCARIARDVGLGLTKRYDLPARKSIQRYKDARLDVLSTALTAATAPAAVVPITLAIAFALRKRGIAAWLPVGVVPASPR